MEQIFQIASNVSTPLSLAGLFAAVLFYILRSVLSKNITFSARSSSRIVILIINRLFALSLIAMVFGFSGFVFTKFTEGKFENAPLQLTVYVHGSKGQQDIVLEQTGELIADFGNDRRVAVIGENGRTNFGEIPVQFKNKGILINVQARGFEALDPDKTFTFTGEPLYFGVKRNEEMHTIHGVVKDFKGDVFLDDVLILVDESTTQTDSLGRFFIELPESKTKESYEVTASKAGYKVITRRYYPDAGSFEIRMPLVQE